MPFTLFLGNTHTVEIKELEPVTLTLIVSGDDARVGHGYEIATSGGAPDILIVEWSPPEQVISRNTPGEGDELVMLTFHAPNGFYVHGTYRIEILRSRPQRAPRPVTSLEIRVHPAQRTPTAQPIPTSPARVPAREPPTRAAPETRVRTDAPQRQNAPEESSSGWSGWQQIVMLCGVAVVIIIGLICLWWVCVGKPLSIIEKRSSAYAEGPSIRLSMDGMEQPRVKGLQVSISADEIDGSAKTQKQ